MQIIAQKKCTTPVTLKHDDCGICDAVENFCGCAATEYKNTDKITNGSAVQN